MIFQDAQFYSHPLQSKLWIQQIIDDAPSTLNSELSRCFHNEEFVNTKWITMSNSNSPKSGHVESLLSAVDISLNYTPRREFWPNRGPRWDALGVIANGVGFGPPAVVLLDAKAHFRELVSGSCRTATERLDLINESQDETKLAFGVNEEVSWTKRYYQYSSRLAFWHLLHNRNDIDTYLLNVYFTYTSDFPAALPTQQEWKDKVAEVQLFLGISPESLLEARSTDCFVDASYLKKSVAER